MALGQFWLVPTVTVGVFWCQGGLFTVGGMFFEALLPMAEATALATFLRGIFSHNLILLSCRNVPLGDTGNNDQ